MIAKDFKLDLKEKRVFHLPKGSRKIYTIRELYSYLQDAFDEPEMMKYDIPIQALSKDKFKLINGWTINQASRKFLKGHISQG